MQVVDIALSTLPGGLLRRPAALSEARQLHVKVSGTCRSRRRRPAARGQARSLRCSRHTGRAVAGPGGPLRGAGPQGPKRSLPKLSHAREPLRVCIRRPSILRPNFSMREQKHSHAKEFARRRAPACLSESAEPAVGARRAGRPGRFRDFCRSIP